MLDLVEVVDPLAQTIGAINTVVFAQDGTATGYNTDATGFMASLPPALKADITHRPALVLGAGGAARAVVAGLIQAQVPALTLAVRNPAKAQDLVALAHTMAQHLGTRPTINCIPLTALDDDPAQQTYLSKVGFVVNTTPLGMAHAGTPHRTQTPLSRHSLEALPTGTWVIDLIYRPRQTQLLQDASRLGHPTQDGLAMLVHQGLQAFTLWTSMSVAHLADDAYALLSETLKTEA
jgi:shikimate dehydrogenase